MGNENDKPANFRRGRLLDSEANGVMHVEWTKLEANAKSKIYTNFFESNNGGSRRLLCQLNPEHPQYELLADGICDSLTNTIGAGINPRAIKEMNDALAQIAAFKPEQFATLEEMHLSITRLAQTALLAANKPYIT